MLRIDTFGGAMAFMVIAIGVIFGGIWFLVHVVPAIFEFIGAALWWSFG